MGQAADDLEEPPRLCGQIKRKRPRSRPECEEDTMSKPVSSAFLLGAFICAMVAAPSIAHSQTVCGTPAAATSGDAVSAENGAPASSIAFTGSRVATPAWHVTSKRRPRCEKLHFKP